MWLQKVQPIFFHRKKVFDKKFHVFHVLSFLMPNPSKWHRATPPVPPVGAANAPRKSGKSRKSSIWIRFHRFWWRERRFSEKSSFTDFLFQVPGFVARDANYRDSMPLGDAKNFVERIFYFWLGFRDTPTEKSTKSEKSPKIMVFQQVSVFRRQYLENQTKNKKSVPQSF